MSSPRQQSSEPHAYSVVCAGSTKNTLTCAKSLLGDERFFVKTVLTPAPKPSGRQKKINPNPLHTWSLDQNIPTVLVKDRLDQEIRQQLEEEFDFLLVADFGYLVPRWLLTKPRFAPINIHPSALARWRGSAPGQYALLFGDQTSAVSIIEMTEKLDQGPIIAQLPFEVNTKWTQTEYYQKSFKLATKHLPDVLHDYALGKIKPKPQPAKSPTPLARQLSKQDAFVHWDMINTALKGQNRELAQLIERATRAFQPWPQLWTLAPTHQDQKKEKRVKILQVRIDKNRLVLEKVQIEGVGQPTTWNQVKNQFLASANE